MRKLNRFDEMEHKIQVEELGSLNTSLGNAIAQSSITKEDLRNVKGLYGEKEIGLY